MAFNTEGWRRLVIGDQVFYWQAPEREVDLFDVRPEREPHRLLRVACSQCGQSGGFFRGATPGVVRKGIECAIEEGWLGERPKLRLVALSDAPRYACLQPQWRTSTVIALAEGIYAESAFERMPILADALQDAGCDSEAVLSHCRDANATHVRGCWVVDLVLGKQ